MLKIHCDLEIGKTYSAELLEQWFYIPILIDVIDGYKYILVDDELGIYLATGNFIKGIYGEGKESFTVIRDIAHEAYTKRR